MAKEMKEATPAPRRKVEIWTALAPFTLAGVEYLPGDEWTQPPGYEFDEAQTAANKGKPTFKLVQQIGPPEKRWELITHDILPVTKGEANA